VQQARFLWSFSATYRFDPQPAYQEMASHALVFLLEQFCDPARLGWYHLVSNDGQTLNAHRHLYAQALAIYGLSEYAFAFGADDALRLASRRLA
jgi:mannobiose 2-epimerase